LIHSILVDKAFREVFVVSDHGELIVFGHEGDIQSSAKKSASTPSKKTRLVPFLNYLNDIYQARSNAQFSKYFVGLEKLLNNFKY
jgi:hypothetical protein